MPLMQGFRTSAPSPRPTISAPASTRMDFAVLPDLASQDAAASDPYAYIRVPLLPDNDSPPAGTRLPEAVDAPLARAEISVVAANPDLVLPAALTEVEGIGVDGVELSFAHELHHGGGSGAGGGREQQQGMLRDIWKGLMDDVLPLQKKEPAF